MDKVKAIAFRDQHGVDCMVYLEGEKKGKVLTHSGNGSFYDGERESTADDFCRCLLQYADRLPQVRSDGLVVDPVKDGFSELLNRLDQINERLLQITKITAE